MSTNNNGRKDDGGKLRWDLLPLDLVEKVVEVYTFGAQKYAPNTWQNLPDGYNRYKAAMLRHLTAHEKGEMIDPDSKLPHLYHVAWNALAMIHFAEKDKTSTDEVKSELKPIVENFATGVLLYVETIDKHRCVIKNIVGEKLFSISLLYHISEPIKELKLTRKVRLANTFEERLYKSFNKTPT